MDTFFRICRWVCLPLSLFMVVAFALTGQWLMAAINLVWFVLWLPPVPRY